MARLVIILRALAVVALAAALSACSAAPAASQAAVVAPGASPTASQLPTASEAPSPSEAPAPTDSPAPKKSTKPLPSIDQSELDAVMTASITLIDLAEADLAVSVGFVDPDSTKPIDLGTYALGFSDQLTNQVPPGTYRLDFRQPADSKGGPTCTIEIGDGDALTFAAIDGAIAISKSGTAPKAARDLFVATSSLCGK
jgi:hypothetical protein